MQFKGKVFENSIILTSGCNHQYIICTAVKKAYDKRYRAHIIQCRIRRPGVVNGKTNDVTLIDIIYENDYTIDFDTLRVGVPYVNFSGKKVYLEGQNGITLMPEVL